MNSQNDPNDIKDLLAHLKKQDERIAELESHLRIKNHDKLVEEEKAKTENSDDMEGEADDILEFKIGQFWFAKLGILVLIVGIIFLITISHSSLPAILPSAIGYIFAISLLLLARKFREKFDYIYNYLTGGGIALLFFATLRLHFFEVQPIVSDIWIETFFLLLITAISLRISIIRNSAYLTAVSLTLGYTTAIVNGNGYFIFTMITILALAIYSLKNKYNWSGLIIFGILISYTTHFIWFINNPVLGNTVEFIHSPQINSLFLLIYMIIFALSNLSRGSIEEDFRDIFDISINLFFCYGLFLLTTIGVDGVSIPFYHIVASIVFLTLAAHFWMKIKSKYATFLMAMFGYMALSVAIVYQFSSPNFFILLCWQSLLVVMTALWFKSKFIIIANFFIYILIFISYLFVEGQLNSFSLSYGIVALLSARILNWKKERLELKTDSMRNGYLVTALVSFPYALYHIVPTEWVSVSWILVALFYYLMSMILKNKKYRQMALATFLITIGYLFVTGMSTGDITYKIIYIHVTWNYFVDNLINLRKIKSKLFF